MISADVRWQLNLTGDKLKSWNLDMNVNLLVPVIMTFPQRNVKLLWRQCILPSMQVSSWATILLSMSLEATSLLGVMASISSMNRIHGAELCKGGIKPIMFREKDTVNIFYHIWIIALILYQQYHRNITWVSGYLCLLYFLQSLLLRPLEW